MNNLVDDPSLAVSVVARPIDPSLEDSSRKLASAAPARKKEDPKKLEAEVVRICQKYGEISPECENAISKLVELKKKQL